MPAPAPLTLRLDGALAVATLSRPPVNAIDEAWLARLEEALDAVERAGAALGGGLALTCDLRIAAAKAPLGLPEARLGLLPGVGGTQRLTRIAGEAIAKRLILGAEIVSGTQAAALGLVHWAVPSAKLPARARALARALTALPAAALAACKRCIQGALEHGTDGYAMEVAATAALLASEETQARVRRFLAGRR
ncbi:MAG: enoyl-CoA hydratase-related protein [Burkholderiales bacterium]